MTVVRQGLTWSLVCWAVAFHAVAGAPPDGEGRADSDAPLLYRRHLMSEELIAEQGEGFLPMRREKFDAAIAASELGARQGAPARLARAAYTATWLDDGVFEGLALLDIAHHESSPAVLSLSPCGLPLGKARWRGDVPPAPVCGVDPQGRFLLLVDREGTLEIPWSLRGVPQRGGGFECRFPLPACSASRLELEIPAGLIPSTGQGVVEPVEGGAPALEAMRRWRVELGGHHDVVLHLRERSDAAHHPAADVRESLTYRLSTTGLEWLAAYQLDIRSRPLRQLEVELPVELQLAVVELNGVSVSRTLLSRDGERGRYLISFPEPVIGERHELRLSGVAPVRVGQGWQLPTPRLPQTEWIAGTASLEVVEPLLAQRIESQDCVAGSVDPLPRPKRGELRQFQSYAPSRGWQVQLARAASELAADTGWLLRCTETVITAQFQADVHAVRGEPFEIVGNVTPGWIVDSVQTDPPEVFEAFETSGASPPELRVQLRQPIRADRKVRLIVRGHRRGLAAGRTATVESLRFVSFPGISVREGLIALAVESPLRLSIQGDQDVTHVDAQALSEQQLSRIGAPAGAALFQDNAAVNGMSISVSPEQPLYSAGIDIDATIDGSTLAQTYDFRLTPERSHVARVVVRFSQGSTVEPSWELTGVPDNSLSVRQLETADSSLGEEVWEVVALRPLNMPFTVRATRKTRFSGDERLALASIAEASSQSGTLRISVLDGTSVQIRTENMTAVAGDRLADSATQTLRGEFRFLPSQESVVYLRRTDPPHALPAAWIWMARLSSRIAGTGEQEHEARLFLENTGLAALAISLPPEALLLRAVVDDGEIDVDTREADGKLTVPLPKDSRFPLVKLTYVLPQSPFRVAATIPSVWPTCGLPCLRRRWDVWTAPGLVVAGPSRWGDLSWDERLCGVPLLRRGGTVFDPFKVADWQSLVNFWTAEREVGDNTSGSGDEIPPPWRSTTELAPWDRAQSSWNRWTVSASEQQWPSVVVVSSRVLQATAWSLLLITFSLLYASGSAYGRSRRAIPLVAAASLFVLPPEYLPLGRGILAGALLANLAIWLPRSRPGVAWNGRGMLLEPVRPDPATTVTLTGGIVLLALCVGAIFSAAARADQGMDETGPVRQPPRPTVHPVLVPVNEQQQPTSDYVYVPRELFDELHVRLAESRGTRSGPLLESAHYDVELSAEGIGDSDWQVRTVTAEYALGQLNENVRLSFPFARDKVRVNDARADGQPVGFEWSPDGQSLQVTIERSDTRLLRLALRPLLAPDSPREISIAVPGIPRSRVTVHAPADLDRVDIPSAAGRVDRSRFGQLQAELGPAGQLHVRWTARDPGPPALPDADVAELLWLQAQPNAMVLRCRITVSVPPGQLMDRVDIEADPRLRPLAPSSEQPWRLIEVNENGLRRVECWLDEPVDRQVTIDLSFALSADLGNLVVPHLRTRAQRRSPAWLAVSAADGLEARILSDGAARTVAPSEFAAAWGNGVEPPRFALRLPEQRVETRIAISPRPVEITAQQELDVTVGNGAAAIAYEAQFNVERGSVLQQLMRVPAEFSLREVVLIHDDISRLLRWVRVDDRTISLFSTVPLTGSFRMWLKGEMPLPRNGAAEIPLPGPARPGPQPMRVRIYRRSDSQVRIEAMPGLVPDPQPAAPSVRLSQGRFLAACTTSGELSRDPSLRLVIAPNRPRIQGSMVTTLTTRDDDWWVEVGLRLTPRNGFLDAIRLRIPPEVEESLVVTPSFPMDTVRIPGERSRQLVIRFPETQAGEIQVTLRGRLALSTPESVRAPDIELLDTTNVSRYVVLPTVVAQRPLSWDTSGLQERELPSPWKLDPEIEATSDVYQVMGAQMRAVVGAQDRREGVPQVPLADFRCRWFADQRFEAWAGFDLDPAGVDGITLIAPPESRLVHVTVAGMVVAPQPLAHQRWRIPIALKHLPQRIEIVFQGRLAASPASHTIAVPALQLADVPFGETLWTVAGPDHFGRGVPVLSHLEKDELFHAGRRLDTARTLWQSAAPRVARESAGESSGWTEAWSQWIQKLELLHRVQRGGAPPRQPLRLWRTRYDLAGPWSVPGDVTFTVTHCAVRGDSPSLELRYRIGFWHPWAARLSLVMMLVAGVWGTRRALRTTWWQSCWRRYPQWIIAALGVAWWLWLSPSAAGLALVLLACLLSVRSGWAARSVR